MTREEKAKARLIEILKREIPNGDHYEKLATQDVDKPSYGSWVYMHGKCDGKVLVAGEILNILLGVDEKVREAYKRPIQSLK